MQIIEGISYRIRLSPKINYVWFEFPYIYSKSFDPTPLCAYIDTENKDTVVMININNINCGIYNIWEHKVIPIELYYISTYCIPQMGCYITIIVETMKNEIS